MSINPLTKSQESRAAIERIYIAMRHLFIRGYYKPFGISGEAIRSALLTLSPEIYGTVADPRKVELEGLMYVIDRLPKGIEECSIIRLVSEEGYNNSGFERIVPAARKRNCFRVDKEQMFVEITRGRSEVYDLLTHLTFLYLEAEKIKQNARTEKGELIRDWHKLEEIVHSEESLDSHQREIAFTYLSTILGRTFEEVKYAHDRFASKPDKNNHLFHIIYWMGRVAMEEETERKDRAISFSPILRERIGHHIYGERWAKRIKQTLYTAGLIHRPLHIISANLHSVMNSLYAFGAIKPAQTQGKSLEQIAIDLSKLENASWMERIEQYAEQHGMIYLKENSGTHISTQIFDTSKMDLNKLPAEIPFDAEYIKKEQPVIFVMDYAFGEQAYETMDELLKPFLTEDGEKIKLNISSISIMGKAGILYGGKGDLMIPTSHVFEGTADNYPFDNALTKEDFEGCGLNVYEGPMISVLGTSLQNKDVLTFFRNTSWNAIGLEMEGAHYQKAIQAASRIRNNINKDVVLRYAYYASDNPLITGSTLASGSLGLIGVKPTYLITQKILEGIFNRK
jgi:hypothetical protein